jgi:hypothetical protein
MKLYTGIDSPAIFYNNTIIFKNIPKLIRGSKWKINSSTLKFKIITKIQKSNSLLIVYKYHRKIFLYINGLVI